MKNVFFSVGLILTSFIFTGCLTTQPIQSDRSTTTDTERQRIKRDAAAQRKETSAEPTMPRERTTPAERASAANCTGGQVWVNNRCECRNNYYWNERLNLCRPIANCRPGERFDREIDRCASAEQQAPAEATPQVSTQKRLKKVESHKFTLYNAPKKNDPYSVQFPIKLDENGLISVDVEIGGGRIRGDGNPFRILIVQARGNKDDTNRIENKYIKKTSYFRTKGTANYPVDASEFQQTNGEYVIIISNLGIGSHGVGTVTFTYPAE
ncbi:MAG: hypothetical protein CVV37_07860 [Nitrospira bacterium HGW-Nitrospira-1]|nr:MAG: hypothetical protein CVV37_07860 [Nitrospira bacterium HGW-Nitrospira-1]